MGKRFNLRKWSLFTAILWSTAISAQSLHQLTTPVPIPAGSTLVIGFLGGYDQWDDDHRSIRQLTLKLRQMSGVYAESISNHRRSVAMEFIVRALDTNQNGKLDPGERSSARVILYGQSWGGAAAIATARDLADLGVPVQLTVQVDSVGQHDQVIPSNVHAAVNFFQHDPFTIQGRSEIRAEDPALTAILGNFQSSYIFRSIDESNASWARRTFGGSHVKMELDPAIWIRVEEYILDAIPRR